jgi:hypothetical protein
MSASHYKRLPFEYFGESRLADTTVRGILLGVLMAIWGVLLLPFVLLGFFMWGLGRLDAPLPARR